VIGAQRKRSESWTRTLATISRLETPGPSSGGR
jgi:hypothetical protein